MNPPHNGDISRKPLFFCFFEAIALKFNYSFLLKGLKVEKEKT